MPRSIYTEIMMSAHTRTQWYVCIGAEAIYTRIANNRRTRSSLTCGASVRLHRLLDTVE